MPIDGPLLLAGCGKMGGALLRGWMARGLRAEQAFVVDPQAPPALSEELGIACLEAPPEGLRPEVVVFAVKPQMMAEVVPGYRALPAAGDPVPLRSPPAPRSASSSAQLGAEAAVVRAMPNTPAAIGRGISVLVANGQVSAAQRFLAETLLERRRRGRLGRGRRRCSIR